MASIQEIMVTEMVVARPDESVGDVVLRMSRNRVGTVLVVSEGLLRGIFTERDLLCRVIAEWRDPRRTEVQQVCTPKPLAVELDWPLRRALETFRQKRFRHLPVVSKGRPVGILSTRDLLDALVMGFERYVDDLKYSNTLADGVDPYDHMGGSYGR